MNTWMRGYKYNVYYIYIYKYITEYIYIYMMKMLIQCYNWSAPQIVKVNV